MYVQPFEGVYNILCVFITKVHYNIERIYNIGTYNINTYNQRINL